VIGCHISVLRFILVGMIGLGIRSMSKVLGVR